MTGLVSLLVLLPELALAQVDPASPPPSAPTSSPPVVDPGSPVAPAADVPATGEASTSAEVNTTAEVSASAEVDAEAEALAAALGDDTADVAAAEAEEFKLNIYGFVDFTYSHVLNDFAFASPYPTFLVGNLNLYAGAELGDGWRTLTEFRLLYVPNGSIAPDQALLLEPERTDTTVGDPADYGRPLRWGGVEIERAFLEYSAHPLLTIRGGQWLTPYGIWIVDHGSPVIIGVRRPYVVGEGLIPERQTGIQIYGSQLVGTTELGYSLSLSNGRGPIDAYQDLDNNKAFTGRVSLVNESVLGNIALGFTVFRGRFTDRFTRFAIAPTGEFGVEYISRNRYEELSMAADVRWIWHDLTIQSEFIMRDTALEDQFRPAAFPAPGEPPGFAPDFRSTGWYVMAAYRLPWLNIMPFFGGESYEPGQELAPAASAIWGGLNVRPTPRVVLKAQFTKSWFGGNAPAVVGDDGIEVLDLQAAWSF